MMGPKIFVLAVLLAVALMAGAQSTAGQGGQDTGSATSVTPSAGAYSTAAGALAQSSLLRVTSPKQGEEVPQSFVDVRFELKNPNTASNFPNFRVQLEGQDPVRTTSPEYTFTGLAPGNHTVTVEIVDANETPVAGSRVELNFKVTQPQPAPGGSPTGAASPTPADGKVVKASLIPEAQNTREPDPLPTSGSSLPLLSVIGFGVLLGGIASALKTR